MLICICLLSTHLQCDYESRTLYNWPPNRTMILNPTPKKTSRTAILIIAPPYINKGATESRWALGKKVWEQYMNAFPNIDCYFVQCSHRKDKTSAEQVWIEGNTIYVGDLFYESQGRDRILHKTITAIEHLLPNYTHFIRTNLNSFFNLNNVQKYTETHHQSMYTGPLWQGEWYVLGYGILFSADVAAHIASEYRRLEHLEIVNCDKSDDCVLTSLATGIYPFTSSENFFSCCPTLPLGVRQLMSQDSLLTRRNGRYGLLLLPPISLQTAIQYCEQASDSVILYRIREGLSLTELAEFYQYLLNKIYPTLQTTDLVEYAKSLQKKIELNCKHDCTN